MNEKSSIVIPNDSKFISNKEVSDRVYTWFLLYGEYRGDGIYIKKWGNKGAQDICLDSRTFNKKISKLIELGYIDDSSDDEYIIKNSELQYKRYIYRDTAQKLLKAKEDNIIKIYMWLGSYYDGYGGGAYFTYSGLLKSIGLSYLHNSRNQKKVQRIVEKLSQMNLLKYEKIEDKGRYDRYRIKEVKK